jgi:hypothetical protein
MEDLPLHPSISEILRSLFDKETQTPLQKTMVTVNIGNPLSKKRAPHKKMSARILTPAATHLTSNARRLTACGGGFNVIVNNDKRDHENKMGKIPITVIAKMEALLNAIDTINDNMSNINNDIQHTRQQYAPPLPPDEPPMSPSKGSAHKHKIDK